MKTIGKKIMGLVPVLLVLVLATGCIFEKNGSGRLQNVLIQVNVSSQEVTKSVAAVAPAAEEAINSIRIFAFYNNRLSGHFYREGTSDEPIVMDLLLPLSGTHNVDFYVVANEGAISVAQGSPAISEFLTQEQLQQICIGELVSPEANGLPLYFNEVVGINVDNISTNNASDIHEGHYWLHQQLNVDLVRPVSKLAVYVAEAEQGNAVYETESPKLTITGIDIVNASQKGYLFDAHDASGSGSASHNFDADINVVNVIGEQNGNAVADSDNYTQVMEPRYFFENSNGNSQWSTGYVETQTDLEQISQGAMLLKIAYSFDSGATSSYAYVKMPHIEKNVFYKVLCRFSPSGGHQEILITVNEWNYIAHTYDEVIVKSK